MSFFSKITDGIKHFQDAVKAGSDFNPLLTEVMTEIEQLHAEGKLNDVVYEAEQAYEKEHADYAAKGTHTNAQDSKVDVTALKHFITALTTADSLPGDLKEKVDRLGNMQELMTKALGPLSGMLG